MMIPTDIALLITQYTLNWAGTKELVEYNYPPIQIATVDITNLRTRIEIPLYDMVPAEFK